jgi:tetratricopeptide (TPR) repeat protein
MERNLRYKWKDSPYRLDERTLERLGLDFEIGFFESVLEKNRDSVSALFSLGELYTQNGDYAEGLAVDERLSALFPFDPTVRYNLACSLSLLDRCDDALEALRKSINLGYDDFETLQNDTDLDNVRNHAGFIELLLSVKDSNRA